MVSTKMVDDAFYATTFPRTLLFVPASNLIAKTKKFLENVSDSSLRTLFGQRDTLPKQRNVVTAGRSGVSRVRQVRRTSNYEVCAIGLRTDFSCV